jgi:hypothetical protein
LQNGKVAAAQALDLGSRSTQVGERLSPVWKMHRRGVRATPSNVARQATPTAPHAQDEYFGLANTKAP